MTPPDANCVQILRAISDGLDCRGYYIWTLVDKYAPESVLLCSACMNL